MKMKHIGLLIALVVAGGSVLAQTPKVVEFTGNPAPATVPFPFRGMIRCLLGGEPAPADKDMPPWCPAGTYTAVTNRVQTARWITSDPNTTGDMTWFHSFTVESANFAGPWWGSFMLNIPGKGAWIGSYSGESEATGTWQLRLIGNGTGVFERATIMAEATVTDPTKPPAITGRYLLPRAQ